PLDLEYGEVSPLWIFLALGSPHPKKWKAAIPRRTPKGPAMARIALLIPSFTEADAVSADVRGMYRALAARGHDVCAVAAHWEVAGLPVRPLRRAGSFLRDSSNLVIYHFSTGCREATTAFLGARCRRVLKYHNVTPAEFFEGIDQEYTLSCRTGR